MSGPRRWSATRPRSVARSPGSSTVQGKDPANDVTEGAAGHAAVRNVEASDGTCANARNSAARGAGLAVEAVDAVHPGSPADARRPGPSVRAAVGARSGPADPGVARPARRLDEQALRAAAGQTDRYGLGCSRRRRGVQALRPAPHAGR